MTNRVALTIRKDGLKISSVKPGFMAWYGAYETALINEDGIIRILEGYDTLEECKKGHEKYCNMSYEELMNFNFID